MISEIYEHSNVFVIIVVFSEHVKYDLTSDFLDFRPHVKGIYIYTCKADFIFNLDGLELELPMNVGLTGAWDMIR